MYIYFGLKCNELICNVLCKFWQIDLNAFNCSKVCLYNPVVQRRVVLLLYFSIFIIYVTSIKISAKKYAPVNPN